MSLLTIMRVSYLIRVELVPAQMQFVLLITDNSLVNKR